MPISVVLALGGEAVVFGVLLFGAAGTLAWAGGWIFLVLFFGMATWITVEIARHDPALLQARMGSPFQRGQPLWDKLVLGSIFPLFATWLVLCAVDSQRGRWSHVPIALEVLGAALVVASMWAIARVFRENTFLAPVVRIQREREHTVVQTGPYTIVRHPMYASVLWLFVGTPLLLGSWYGLFGSVLLASGVVIRTALEDRELQHSLTGYIEYTRHVRSRLVPFVW